MWFCKPKIKKLKQSEIDQYNTETEILRELHNIIFNIQIAGMHHTQPKAYAEWAERYLALYNKYKHLELVRESCIILSLD